MTLIGHTNIMNYGLLNNVWKGSTFLNQENIILMLQFLFACPMAIHIFAEIK